MLVVVSVLSRRFHLYTPLGYQRSTTILRAVSALDLLLVAAVLVGISVQAAIGFGFAFFVAPAAFAAFPPEQAVTLVLLLGDRDQLPRPVRRAPRASRSRAGRSRSCSPPRPGLVARRLVVTEADRDLLQLLVGVVVLAGAGGCRPPAAPAAGRRDRRRPRWRSAAASPPGR